MFGTAWERQLREAHVREAGAVESPLNARSSCGLPDRHDDPRLVLLDAPLKGGFCFEPFCRALRLGKVVDRLEAEVVDVTAEIVRLLSIRRDVPQARSARARYSRPQPGQVAGRETT